MELNIICLLKLKSLNSLNIKFLAQFQSLNYKESNEKEGCKTKKGKEAYYISNSCKDNTSSNRRVLIKFT